MSEAPWALVDFWDRAEGSDGETFIVEIAGLGTVRIERWYTRNTSGVDVYNEHGNEVSIAVEAHLGEVAFEYLVGDWLQAVGDAYLRHLDAVHLNQIKQDAVERARRVPVEPPSADG